MVSQSRIMRTNLAMIKEYSELLMHRMLDDNSYPELKTEDEDIIDVLHKCADEYDGIISNCIHIAIAELTYIKYTRILDEIEQNTGESE